MFKAPSAQEAVGRNLANRGEKRSKRHLPVNGRGVPLPIVATGANERSFNATSGTRQIPYHAADQITIRAQWQQGEERALDVIRTWRWE